jgi:nucleoside 2-deoxyribosyltransferase
MSGYLKNKQVYLCGPMWACGDDGSTWRQKLTPTLESYGLVVEDPTKKSAFGVGEVGDDKKYFKELIAKKEFGRVKKEFWPIIRKDLRTVDKSDFLIAVYDPTIHMCGTFDEIIRARQQKKPVLFKYDESQLAYFNPWVLSWVKEEWLFSNWDDMLCYLSTKIDNRDFDSSHWTLE